MKIEVDIPQEYLPNCGATPFNAEAIDRNHVHAVDGCLAIDVTIVFRDVKVTNESRS